MRCRQVLPGKGFALILFIKHSDNRFTVFSLGVEF
jgi:hypothetical protein